MPGIFIKRGTELVELQEQPYQEEAVLQRLIASHPELLSSGIADTSLLLVRREAGVSVEAGESSRWSLDHLFVDTAGVPVLVEVKRSTDTRIRREVVGQMLDYAAGSNNWTADVLERWFRERCAEDGLDPDLTLEDHAGDINGFWDEVAKNVIARHLRMVFVADVIPPELRRVIEFLNEQMTSEVIGIEVKQFMDTTGTETIISPSVLGRTQRAAAKTPALRSARRQWDLESVIDAATELAGPRAAEVCLAVARWTEEQPGMHLWFGTGAKREWGSMVPILDQANQTGPFSFWTSGTVQISFQYLVSTGWAPFDDLAMRKELQARLNQLPGVAIPDDRLDKRPSVPAATLADSLPAFLEIVQWTFDQARGRSAAPLAGSAPRVDGAAPAR